MLKTIAFDFDGTLADSLELCIATLERVFAKYLGANAPSRAKISARFGMNEEGIMRCFIPAASGPALRDFYRFYAEMHDDFCPAPFPGIREFLSLVRQLGLQITLLTGKTEISAQLSIQKLGLAGIFTDCRYGSPTSSSKAPQLNALRRDFGLEPEELIYVGDAVSDVQSAREAGIRCLSAAWAGTAQVTELEKINPGLVFRSMPDMLDYLQKLAPVSK